MASAGHERSRFTFQGAALKTSADESAGVAAAIESARLEASAPLEAALFGRPHAETTTTASANTIETRHRYRSMQGEYKKEWGQAATLLLVIHKLVLPAQDVVLPGIEYLLAETGNVAA